jgi:hypothetical protein
LTAKIKFVPKKGNAAGPFYGVKIIKGDVSALSNQNN